MTTGVAALRPLLLVLLAAPQGGPGAAAPAHRAALLVQRFEWAFETTDLSGRELYAMTEVPIYLGGRPTHPQWVQEFGARADPLARDRFPREPGAGFQARDASGADRCLHLTSRGDHALVHLARAVPVAGGVALRLEAEVRLQGLREGSLVLRVRFGGDGLSPAERVLAGAPLRGDHDWKKVEVGGRVPEQARELDVEVLLLGSYEDGPTQAWVDSLALELSPSLSFDWGKRSFVLFGPEDVEIPFEVEARGLPPGGYLLEGQLTPLSPERGATPGTARAGLPVGAASPAGGARSFSARRYLPLPSGEGPVPLRFHGDLRRMFGEPPPAPGLFDLRVQVRGPLGPSPGERGEVAAERSDRVGFLPAGPREGGPGGLRLGFSLKPIDLRRGDLELIPALPRGFPLDELLWDLAAEPVGGGTATLPPSPARGGQSGLSWCGRIGAAFLRDPRAPALLLEWAPAIHSWAVEGDLADPRLSPALKAVRESSGLLSLGWSGPGPRPSWAGFSEVPLGPERLAAGGGGRAVPHDPGDRALLEVSRTSDERGDFVLLAGLLLDLARAGHHRVFVRGAADLLAEPAGPGRRTPRLPVFAWWGLGRLLSGRTDGEKHAWDPRGRFVAVREEGKGHALCAMARAEPFVLRLWTGAPLEGEDLFGARVAVPFDALTLSSELTVKREPVIYHGLELPLLETLDSLAEVGPGLRPVPTSQELAFRLTNRTEKPLRLKLALELPHGSGVSPESLSRALSPGEEAVFPFRVLLPAGTDRLRSRLQLELDHGGRLCRFSRERELEVRSSLVRLAVEAAGSPERRLELTLESLSARPLKARVDCRVLLGDRRDLLESWEERLPPRARRSLTLPLRAPDDLLAGREVRVGVQVEGSPELLSERYVLGLDGPRLVLERR